MIGDDDASEEEAEDADELKNEDEEGTSGMQPPEGALPSHHDEVEHEDGDSDGSGASSGLEDADMEAAESADEGEVEALDEDAKAVDEVGKDNSGKSVKLVGAVGSKVKAYHFSAEWIQLVQLEKDQNIVLTRIPEVVGAGVHRHPAKNFWSSSYPGCAIKSCSWGTTRTPLECLAKCLKHVVKQHTIAFPQMPEMSAWKSQLESLSSLNG